MVLAQVVADEDLSKHFENWDESRFLNPDRSTKRFILRMTRLAPDERATIEQIMNGASGYERRHYGHVNRCLLHDRMTLSFRHCLYLR